MLARYLMPLGSQVALYDIKVP